MKHYTEKKDLARVQQPPFGKHHLGQLMQIISKCDNTQQPIPNRGSPTLPYYKKMVRDAKNRGFITESISINYRQLTKRGKRLYPDKLYMISIGFMKYLQFLNAVPTLDYVVLVPNKDKTEYKLCRLNKDTDGNEWLNSIEYYTGDRIIPSRRWINPISKGIELELYIDNREYDMPINNIDLSRYKRIKT